MKIIKGILLLLNCIWILATLGAYLSPYVPPAENSLFPLLGLLSLGLLVGHLGFVLFWSWVQPKWAIFSLFTLLVGIPATQNMFALNFGKKQSSHEKSLKIATYNMQFSKPLIHAKEKSLETMEQNFEAFLKSMDDLDILGVQECGWRTKEHINKAMQFPYQHFIGNIYTGIYSKHPIIYKGFVDFGQRINKCLWADIAIGKDTLRFYVTHLEPNRFDGKVPLVLNQEKKENLDVWKLAGIAKYQSIFTKKRTEQAALIRAHQKKSPYPSILVGDFNDLPQSYTYALISAGLKDTFLESGFGMGTTHGSFVPGLRIDYILVEEIFSVAQHTVHRVPFSDHYLVEGAIGF